MYAGKAVGMEVGGAYDIQECITKEQIVRGHGSMDCFCFKTFFENLRDNKPMPVDVYNAASWMAFTPLSAESIEKGSFVEIPDFTKGAYKTRERLDVEVN